MKICTIDGIAYYAGWLIRAELGNRYHPFEADKSGILCFMEKELARAEVWLQEQGITYKIEKLPAPPGFEKTIGINYSSRSEAVRHIQEDVEPKSLTVLRLCERVQAAESRAEAAEDKAEAAEQRAAAAEIKARAAESRAAHIDALEVRLQSLEKAAKEVGGK